MWLTLSLLSALFLGLNEVAKKSALNSNAVIPVLAVSIWISALLFLPLQISSMAAPTWIRESAFYIPPVSAEAHWGIVLKAVIVLGSWIFGFFATKHLPLTISASIKATRPAFVVLGAVLIFGERLDATRWTGVAIVLGALAALSRLDKRDGRDDRESPRRKTLWLWFLIASTLLGAASALWDKFLIARYDRLAVQAYTCYYQSLMMIAIVMTMWYPSRKRSTPFRWRWSIFLTAAGPAVGRFDDPALGRRRHVRRGRADVPRAADRHEGRAARCRAGRSRAALFRITYRKFRKASRQGKQTAGALRPKPARTRRSRLPASFNPSRTAYSKYPVTLPTLGFSTPPASSYDVPSEEISRQGLIGCAACGRKPQLTDTEIRVRTRMAHRSIRSPRNISKAVNTKEAVHDSDSLLYFPSQERRHGTPEG